MSVAIGDLVLDGQTASALGLHLPEAEGGHQKEDTNSASQPRG